MPDDKRRVPACEEADAISARLSELRAYRERRCFQRCGRLMTDCWCYHAGPHGFSLPCPPEIPT